MKLHYNEYPKFSIHGEIRKSLIIFIWLKKTRAFLFHSVFAYYAFQYPLDFGADETHHSCLTAANFRGTAAYFEKKQSTKSLAKQKGVIQH